MEPKNCLFCHKGFTPHRFGAPSRGGNRGKYCSVECFHQAKRVTKPCENCGTSFEVPDTDDPISRSLGNLRRFCANCSEARAAIDLEREEKEGILVHVEVAKSEITRALAPLRSRLLALPPRLAPLVNPADPDMARKELEIAIEEVLKGTK